MTDKSELAKWWDKTHEGKDIMWTTDTSGEGVWKNLKVKDLIKTSKTVLDIGVGLGRGTKDLYNEGLEVHGLDISIVALNKVKPFTKNQYLPTDELPKNYFDLAISHLVAQHMCDEDLLEQMKKVILSLKPSGIFAMQFASFKDCNYGTLNPNILNLQIA